MGSTRRSMLLAVAGGAAAWLSPATLRAQFDRASPSVEPPPPGGVRLDKSHVTKWQVGVTITAAGGPVQGIFATIPVPTDWPEQRVQVAEEKISPTVARVAYRGLEGGARQMLVSIPLLPAGQTADALVTFEVERHTLSAPADTSVFRLAARPPRDVLKFLAPSPYIESQHAQIRTLAREVVAGKEGAWEQVEAIYDWVRDHVEYEDGPLKGALAALRDGKGDCEELTSLFIALCRAHRIPARTVWVPDHCYPEFYLEDAQGRGHWLPCQAAGTRDFGSMPETRPILQKGDNFRVPEKREPQRYVAEFLKASGAPGGPPTVIWTRRLLDE